MCNINVLIRKDGKKVVEVRECMNAMSYHSFCGNSDGEGMIFEDGTVIRSANKIILRDVTPSKIIAHERLTTSGDGDENLHPHVMDDFALVHNGIFSALGDAKESDTKKYAKMLQEEFVKTKDLVKAIKKVHKKVNGSYSICIVEKATGEIYYYKNDRTSMFYASDKDYFVMSTNENNVIFATLYLKMKAKVKKVPSYKIFKVVNALVKVGKLKKERAYDYFGLRSSASDDSWMDSLRWDAPNKTTGDALKQDEIRNVLEDTFNCLSVEILKEEVWVTCAKDTIYQISGLGVAPEFIDTDGEGLSYAKFRFGDLEEALEDAMMI